MRSTHEELLAWIEFWFMGDNAPGSLDEEEQAYKQIKEMIESASKEEETASNARDAYGGYREDE